MLWGSEVDFGPGVTDPPAGWVGRSDASDPRIWAEQGRSVGHIPPKNFRRAARGGSVGRTRPTPRVREILERIRSGVALSFMYRFSNLAQKIQSIPYGLIFG